MNNQQHGARSGSYGVPPLFALCDAVFSENGKGIVKNKRSRLKRQAVVLPLVDPVLFIVPFKPHRYTKCITHEADDLFVPHESRRPIDRALTQRSDLPERRISGPLEQALQRDADRPSIWTGIKLFTSWNRCCVLSAANLKRTGEVVSGCPQIVKEFFLEASCLRKCRFAHVLGTETTKTRWSAPRRRCGEGWPGSGKRCAVTRGRRCSTARYQQCAYYQVNYTSVSCPISGSICSQTKWRISRGLRIGNGT